MRLSELLSPDRIVILRDSESSLAKPPLLRRLAALLAPQTHVDASLIEGTFVERESVQSTGIGGGVAIPHGAMAQLTTQCAALIVSRAGVDFDAIDGAPVHLIFGVIGPKHAAGVHLKTLARISRVLRNRDFCVGLAQQTDASDIYRSLVSEDGP
jgi:PTS system nitrogen regulatory IIA component